MGARLPSRAANSPPDTNTNALATPANKRCTKSTVASVKKPHNPINRAAINEPAQSNNVGDTLRIRPGMANAPSRYPTALAVFMAPASV